MPQPSTAKRLAKNTALMYGRMFILMFISLYTARIVLAQLGIDNYGIYSVVGSVLAMFNSLRAIFASSTQRFLNYEMGQGGNRFKMQLVFNLSIKVNAIIVGVLFVLLEVVGLWFINYKMNVDPLRLFATNVVFQISVISTLISVFTTTFDAEIIAHERMDFFAYVSIFEAVMKLLIVYLLTITPFDKLIFYAVLLFGVHTIVFVINILYCRRNFAEVRLKNVHDKQYFKKMTKFAGWNFFGNTAFSMNQNVLNMILNVFGGTIVNAARGVCYQVKGFFDQFVYNVSIVLVPFSIKTYSGGNRKKFYDVVYFSSKILFSVQYLISLVVIYLTSDILMFWLGQVPEYSVDFIRLIMSWLLVRALHNPIDTVFKANGNLKQYQLTEICILSLPMFITYIGLKLGAGYNIAFTSMIFCEVVNFCSILFVCSKQTDLLIWPYVKAVIIPCFSTLLVGLLFFITLQRFEFNLLQRILITVVACILSIVFMLFVGLSKFEQAQLISLLPAKFRRNRQLNKS